MYTHRHTIRTQLTVCTLNMHINIKYKNIINNNKTNKKTTEI